MPAKAFSIEDGNANIKSLIGARKASYTDIDLAFANKPAGDIFKKTNAAAVKQAVKNLLMTNIMEKPFDISFGGNLSDFMFENDTEIDVNEVSYRIIETVQTHEPRADILDVNLTLKSSTNEIRVTVEFQVVATNEIVQLEFPLARLR
jgi:phage baseplate assembly protein W|tara:strand:- start:301 stop:744 length:444 start_codon:yes stop_codon:yes gene_type:complete